mgnify:FL=1
MRLVHGSTLVPVNASSAYNLQVSSSFPPLVALAPKKGLAVPASTLGEREIISAAETKTAAANRRGREAASTKYSIEQLHQALFLASQVGEENLRLRNLVSPGEGQPQDSDVRRAASLPPRFFFRPTPALLSGLEQAPEHDYRPPDLHAVPTPPASTPARAVRSTLNNNPALPSAFAQPPPPSLHRHGHRSHS